MLKKKSAKKIIRKKKLSKPKKQTREALVAIIGEPNVGKSTLLNRTVHQRLALVTPEAGTTRDRFYAQTSWNGLDFTLIDTAGIILDERGELEINVQKQAQIAIKQADLIIYLVDGKKNTANVNRQIIKDIRREKKPIILVANKIDSPKIRDESAYAYQFTGIKEIFAISALSGGGVGDLLDNVVEKLKTLGFKTLERDQSEIQVAIVGKPNVGKSSFFNAVLGEERVVVSEKPGTTRNIIDTLIEYKKKKIKFLDTAGLKRRTGNQELPDIYATVQTLREIKRADICILMIDGSEGISQQDQRVAGLIVNAKKGLILAVNKIDKLAPAERKKLVENLDKFFEFLWWSPAVPVSAKKKEGIEQVLDYILEIDSNRRKIIEPDKLQEFFKAKMKIRQPQRIRDERVPKIFGIRQVATANPTFIMLVNEPSAIAGQFRKFIENAIVKELGFWGTPVDLKLEPKSGNPAEKALN